MATSFWRVSKLRRWLSNSDRPEVVQICKEYFDKAFSPPSDVHKPTTRISSPPVDVLDDLCLLMGRRRATLQAHVHYDGSTYSRSSTHLGNSLVRFYPKGNLMAKPVPGSIKYIFHDQNLLRLAVQRQKPLCESIDPFRPYSLFPAKLFSSELSETLEMVKLEWLVGHYARWTMPSGHAVVLSLNRD